jgi:meso-butanediol dehydrogenase / (S,S)-butanediol dehydrogenase / diacetyl reductase
MRRAVVTGAAGGIGSATAAAFAERGYEVVGLEAGDDGAAALGALDRIDALVCAHGGSGRRFGDGPVDRCTDEGWERTLDLNLTSVFRYCRAAIPALRANGGGAIVTLSSALALGGDVDFATHAYAAAKGALISLTRAMAVAYAADRIRCNVVCAGLIATPMSARAQADERIRARLPELQPLTGGFGEPAVVADALVHLAEAPFTTGAVLAVDGGWSAR